MANSNTGKFHYAGCRYVNMMSQNHKVFYDSRDEAINAGFVPCKVCRP
ncbi:Ada metal-binding domain-containing protein [Pelosinus sp. IPA-1]